MAKFSSRLSGMKLRMFHLFDVPVYIDITVLLLLWIFIPAIGAASTILVLMCMLAHEFGHVLVARRYGHRTHSVTIHGLGAVAMIVGNLQKGEAVMAAAGPAVNFVIAAFIVLVTSLLHLAGVVLPTYVASTMNTVAFLNVAFGVFNLFPVYPMDGGRIVRGMLLRWATRDRLKATKIVAIIGTTLAACLLPLAFITGNFMLGLIMIVVPAMAWFEVKHIAEYGERGTMY